MICSKCGYENLEEARFCENCGSNLLQHYETAVKANMHSRSQKKLIIIIVSAILLITTVIVATLLVLGSNLSSRANQLLVSGEKYLIEMNYEQAIIEFDKVLDIDPNNAYAYIGKAEALSAIGRKDEALEILEKGYSITDDERIAKKINVYCGEESPSPSGGTSSTTPSTSSAGTPSTTPSSSNSDTSTTTLSTPSSSTSSTTSSSSSSSAQSSSTKNSIEPTPIDRISLEYVDVSEYFDMSDTLNSIADGQIINASKTNDYNPYKSVFLSGDFHLTELDEVFTSGIYCTEEHALVGWDKSELVHNNGMQHVYKATSEGTELIKTSKYPMYVTEDGYIAYYSFRSDSSVTVNIQSPDGNIVSSTTIDGYSEPVGWAYGGVVDRLSISDSVFSFVDTKGAPFSYHLYTEQVRNAATGYYDTKYVQYLFYKNGKVVLDEVLIEANVGSDYEATSCPESLSRSGKKYLRSYNVTSLDNNVVVVEYYDSNYTPIDGMDGYYIEPEYAAYALVNTENGKYSQLYKEISSANNGLYIATDFNGKKRYIDNKGHEVSTKYEDIGSFDSEYSFVLEDDVYYLIDSDFEKLLKIEGTNVKVVGNNMFSCIRNRKLYLFNVG